MHLIGSINDANNGSESEYNDVEAVAIYTKSSNSNASLISRQGRLRTKAPARRGMGGRREINAIEELRYPYLKRRARPSPDAIAPSVIAAFCYRACVLSKIEASHRLRVRRKRIEGIGWFQNWRNWM